MTEYLPAGTIAIAGLDLDRLRTSPLYRKLPDSVRALTAPYQDASRLLVAYDGKNVLVIARRNSRDAPALFGPPDAVRAAQAQQRTGRTAVPHLAAFADSIAEAYLVWAAAQGGATLPFTGNATNVNRLLSKLEFAGLTAQLDPTAVLRLTALGRTAEDARQVEETLRGMLTLGSTALSRQPDIAALIGKIPVDRRDRTVAASVTVPQTMLDRLIQLLLESRRG